MNKPKRPHGDSPWALAAQAEWDLLFGTESIFADNNASGCPLKIWKNSEGKYELSLKIPPQNSTKGWFWISGKRKYAPLTNSYIENQIVKILPTDSIVTTGIVCAGGITIKATPGKWVATQFVPKLKNDGTDNPAYIPQLPLPSGDYDPDNAANFWELVTPSDLCVDGSSVIV